MKIKGNIPDAKTQNVLERLLELSEEAMSDVAQLKTDALNKARKKHALAKQRSISLPKYKNEGKSQEMRDAAAFHEFDQAFLEFEEADAIVTASVEKVKTSRQVLSALQTFINSEKAVADMLGYGQTKST